MGVGGLLGKIFGGDSARKAAVLRAYGKLPMYAEYRRLDVAPGTPTQFTQWLDDGRLAWARSATRRESGGTRSSRLMFRLPGSKETVVATVWDSRDSLGRVFPFCFFVVCPSDGLGRDPLQQWVCATTIHHTFDRLRGELTGLSGGGDFYRLYQKRAVGLKPEDLSERLDELQKQAERISPEAWFQAAVDGQTQPQAWIEALGRRARRWAEQPEASEDLALLCPLSPTFSLGAQVLTWLQWLNPIARQRKRLPNLILQADGDQGARAVAILLRDVMPDDFQLLTSDAQAYNFVERLSATAAGESADPSEVVVARHGSWLDWMLAHAPSSA